MTLYDKASMTLHDKAELRFQRKQRQMADGLDATAEYEQRALAEREKTVRLRALRLARDSGLAAEEKEKVRRKTDQMLRRQKLAVT
jgi:hypothetical protein